MSTKERLKKVIPLDDFGIVALEVFFELLLALFPIELLEEELLLELLEVVF